MALSNELISQFVKITKDDKKVKTESTIYGTVVYDGKPYVKLDGSDLLTPVSTTTDVKDGERVTVLIKDHTATITGNISSPSARTDAVKDSVGHAMTGDDIQASDAHIERLLAVLADIKYLNADEVTAVMADIEKLRAEFATIGHIDANSAKILTAEIEAISGKFADFTNIEVDDLEALNAEITTLKGYTADFTYISAERFEAAKAEIEKLNVEKLSVQDADIKYANIDFANIDEAAIGTFFAKSGVIEDYKAENGTVTGKLIAVSINADNITAGSLAAERIMLQGDDGLFYRLNVDALGQAVAEELSDDEQEKLKMGIHGKSIIAKTITADEISVSDLVAFGATIGGFRMSDGSLYSGIKESIDNTTQGIYMDSDGQMNIGDNNSYMKYYKATDGGYRLRIQTDNIHLNGRDVADTLDCIRINPADHSITIGAGQSEMSLVLRNDVISFEKDGERFGWWDGNDFHTGNIAIDVTERAQFGNFAMIPRSDGSLSFLKVQDRAGFYAIVGGGVMTIYGAYPILEDRTMIVSDVSGSLDNTTLILGGGTTNA